MTDRMVSRLTSIRTGRPLHRGIVSLWTLLMIPVLLVVLAVVVEGVHLWLARVELENGLEAAALAAVKEWAESGGMPTEYWTEQARQFGVEYAAANAINQTPITIQTNRGGYADPGNPNENLSCEGNLIFGAITEDNPRYVFESDKVPSCGGGGRLLIDVTSQNLDATDNSWGVSFPTDPDPVVNQTLLIDRIVIDVDPEDTGVLRFNLDPSSGGPPTLSDNNPTVMVQGWAPDYFRPGELIESEQHDNYGFLYWFNTTSPENPTLDEPDGRWPNPGPPPTTPQITFEYDSLYTDVLTIRFHAYNDGMGNYDAGFSPGDRFRFGAGVERAAGGDNWATANGDDIGRDDKLGQVGARITVFFKDINGNPLPPLDGVSSYFVNTKYSSNDCADKKYPGVWEIDDLGNYHLLVHPIRLPFMDPTPLIARDLPCPLTSAANNDKQSIVLALGTGGMGNYAVRAQASHAVPSLICGFCGITFGPFNVSACATAMYDCLLQRPRLIRVERENFFCPTRPPAP